MNRLVLRFSLLVLVSLLQFVLVPPAQAAGPCPECVVTSDSSLYGTRSPNVFLDILGKVENGICDLSQAAEQVGPYISCPIDLIGVDQPDNCRITLYILYCRPTLTPTRTLSPTITP